MFGVSLMFDLDLEQNRRLKTKKVQNFIKMTLFNHIYLKQTIWYQNRTDNKNKRNENAFKSKNIFYLLLDLDFPHTFLDFLERLLDREAPLRLDLLFDLHALLVALLLGLLADRLRLHRAGMLELFFNTSWQIKIQCATDLNHNMSSYMT